MDLPCTHLPFLEAYLFSRQAAVPAPGAECSFPLSGEISLPYRQPALESPSFLCPIININHNLADEKKFPVFVISCQSSPSFSQFGKTNVHCSMSRGLTKQGCYRPRRRIPNMRSRCGPQVELWGLPAGLWGRTTSATCHITGLTQTWEGPMEQSLLHSLHGHHSPGPEPAGRGELVPILWHIPGTSEGEKRCPESGAGDAAPAVTLRQSCLQDKGLLRCQLRQSLCTS